MKERISYIRRGATVAWGPTHETASYIAAGTVAGAISDSFDASASLEIFNLDLPKRAGTLSVSSSTREAALGPLWSAPWSAARWRNLHAI